MQNGNSLLTGAESRATLTSVTDIVTDYLASKPLLRLQSGLCNQKGHFSDNNCKTSANHVSTSLTSINIS